MKKECMAAMAALIIAGSLSGCKTDISLTTAEETVATEKEETTENVAETTSEPETAETETSEAVTTEEETTEEETTSETKKSDEDEEWDSIGEKYRALLKYTPDEAREYFDVEVDNSLGEEDFLNFCDGQVMEIISSDRFTLHNYVSDLENFDIDLSDVPFDLGKAYVTLEDQQEAYDINLSELKEMLSIPEDELTTREQLAYDKLYYVFIVTIWGDEVKPLSSPVIESGNAVDNVGSLFYEYTFSDTEDVDEYLENLYLLPDYIDTIAEGVEYQYKTFGYAPTDDMLKTCIDSAAGLVDDDDNVFIDGFDTKIDALGLDGDTAEKYKETNKEFIENSLKPALKKCEADLETFMGTNKKGTGLSGVDGGSDYFEYLLERETSSGMSPEEIMDMLWGHIKTAVKKLTIQANLNYNLYEDYYNGDYELPGGTPEEILAYLEENMSDVFPKLPDCEVTISYLPKSLQIDGLGAYYIMPRLDYTDLNVIRVNGATDMDLYLVLAHEGYPGHMLQFNIFRDTDALQVENICDALGYDEGWAMVAYYKALDYSGLSTSMNAIIYYDTTFNYDLISFADIAVNAMGWSEDTLASYFDKLDLDGSALAEYLYTYAINSIGNLETYSIGYWLADEIIEDQVENGATYKEAYAAFLEVGNASFDIVKKYIGSDF